MRRKRKRKCVNPDVYYTKSAVVKFVFSLIILFLTMWLFIYWVESVI